MRLRVRTNSGVKVLIGQAAMYRAVGSSKNLTRFVKRLSHSQTRKLGAYANTRSELQPPKPSQLS